MYSSSAPITRWRCSRSRVRETLNGEALIDKGLSAGETVVVRGQYRLTPGTVVSLANPNDPAAVPNPTSASAGLLP